MVGRLVIADGPKKNHDRPRFSHWRHSREIMKEEEIGLGLRLLQVLIKTIVLT